MQYYKLIVRDSQKIKVLKNDLEVNGLLNKNLKIEKDFENDIVIFLIYTLIPIDHKVPYEVEYDTYEFVPQEINLSTLTLQFYKEQGMEFKDELTDFLPKKWIIYDPMILFNSNTYDSTIWTQEFKNINSDQYFQFILRNCFPKITHIAINKPIIEEANVMRVPMNILPLYGDFGPKLTSDRLNSPTSKDFQDAFWCHTIQNGIYQTWAPMYTMFSRGNIKEKKRILDEFNHLQNTWTFDLYAGIGYFSLSYLKNGSRVVCFELNPWSVEALVRNCATNGFSYELNPSQINFHTNCEVQAYIFNESNENVINRINDAKLPISHINLGLLPSSQQSWPFTKTLLTHSTMDTLVHIHENVHIDDIDSFNQSIVQYFPQSQFRQTAKVKTFAPSIWHIVSDLVIINDVSEDYIIGL